MTIYIQKECLLKAARAFLVFKAVEEFGEILVYNPSSQDIEDEKFDCDFSIFIASDEPYEKIAEAAKSVSEIDKVVGEEVKYETLAAKQEKAEADAAAAEKSQDAPAEAAPAQEQPQAQAVKPAAKTQSSGNRKQTVAKPVTNRTVRVDIEAGCIDGPGIRISSQRTVWCRSAPPIPEISRTSPSMSRLNIWSVSRPIFMSP